MLKDKLHGRKFYTDSEIISTVQNSLKQLLKKAFLLVLKSGLNNGTIACHLKKGTLKKNDLPFSVNIFLDFTLGFYRMPFVY